MAYIRDCPKLPTSDDEHGLVLVNGLVQHISFVLSPLADLDHIAFSLWGLSVTGIIEVILKSHLSSKIWFAQTSLETNVVVTFHEANPQG